MTTKPRKKYLEAKRAWAARNPEKRRAQQARYNSSAHGKKSRAAYAATEKAKAICKASYLKYRYGLSTLHHQALTERQHNRCAVCRKPPSGVGSNNQSLHVDHNHGTGRVRGLLCADCNRALGMAKDDPMILRALARYVETDGVAHTILDLL